MTEPKTILLIRRSGASRPEFAVDGRAIVERDLGAVPSVDFDAIVAIVVTPDPLEAAIAETRRLRVDLGDRYRPIYWLGPADATTALSAGADAVLAEPFAESFANQFVSGTRVRERIDELRFRVARVEPLADAFSKVRVARLADAEFASAALALAAVPPPERFIAFRIESTCADDEATATVTAGPFGSRLRLVAVTVPGRSLAASLTAMTVCQLAISSDEAPGERLRHVNRALARRPTEFLPAAAAILDLDGETGNFRLAQAGLPNAGHIGTEGRVETLAFGESRLGIFESVYPTRSGRLDPGESLSVGERPLLYVQVLRDHLP